ncbi:MAG: methylated-DNA--[protein]-cysteine S-methyltransferase [Chloroflexota bacterium]|nr:methylated-DNA--[protein]-cysteine S-methyltransferase [Chloroflexota bacterium]MDE2931375.1 methylated-DNA--[protein]-cysteine S-methyltransferase [Chloroflexota bacterium]
MEQHDDYHGLDDYQRIERAIEFLAQNFRSQPQLDEVAASVHLSKYHFLRLFKRWAGVTPTQFLHYLTVEYAKERLAANQSVFATTFDAGLSSPSRLHDLFVTFEAMTPGEHKRHGAGLEIAYGFHPTPFGECLLATTPRGICALRFVAPLEREQTLTQLRAEWPDAQVVHRPAAGEPLVRRLFRRAHEEATPPFHLLLKGTNFQIQVWQALLAIPFGALASYQAVAAHIAAPSAARAVGRVIAQNPIAYLIPCHRVITKVGAAHRYRWGTAKKQAMIGWEASRLHKGLLAPHAIPARID